jgi:hypothetical protein
MERSSDYFNSHFTHVLYFYAKDSHLETLLRRFGMVNNVGFSSIIAPQTVHTRMNGSLHFNLWFKENIDE